MNPRQESDRLQVEFRDSEETQYRSSLDYAEGDAEQIGPSTDGEGREMRQLETRAAWSRF